MEEAEWHGANSLTAFVKDTLQHKLGVQNRLDFLSLMLLGDPYGHA